jgi:hypothetical protein
METIGPIPIPEPVVIGTFPVSGDYGGGMDWQPPVAVHLFDEPGLKTEQRFVLGSGARRFRVQRDHLSCDEYERLKAHWIQAQGCYAQFPFSYVEPGGATVVYTVRYENPAISFDHLIGLLTGNPGVTLLEVSNAAPEIPSAIIVSRFPDATFTNALRQETQHIIPMIAIQDRDGGAPLHLSNQKFRITTTDASVTGLYQPRLLDWQGISQTLGEASDSARFTFGNADGVFTQLVNQINLSRAFVQFMLYHVESGYLCKLWSGYALPWSFDSDGHFQLGASDGAFELNLAYPTRLVSRMCWKVYKGRFCPSISSLPDCPKSWEACNDRGVPRSFGGLVSPPQAIHIKDNSTGTWGFGRSQFTSVSVASDTIYERPIQEVYTDEAMVVIPDIAMGRDESEYYAAIGVIGEGPISGYSLNFLDQLLDDQPPHDPMGQKFAALPGLVPYISGGGWRGILGTDPAGVNDYFGISQDPWDQVPPGSTYAGGLAFAEIRRTDEVGLQLSKLTERSMSVTVTGGMGGWTWTAPGARTWTPSLSNFVWVAVNVYLRALGLRATSANAGAVSPAEMEAVFDVQQAIDMAAIADRSVPKLVGEGMERQFPFRGALKEQKPMRDWLQEIVNCGLGYYTFVNGKLWIGIRDNSSVLAGNAYTRATILFKSLNALPVQPSFNWLTGQFGDEEFQWQLNNVTVYDIEHASFIGKLESPRYLNSTMTLVGVSNKSQAARVISTRLREELGGVGLDQQRNARHLQFSTTVLGLRTMVGDIVSMGSLTDPDPRLPNGYCEGRVVKWTLNPDYSIDLEASPTTDEMYDLVSGPKPDDVPAEPVPPEILPSISGLTWMPNEVGPFLDDPLYPDMLERTFAVWQDYTITREGVWDPAIRVRGEMCINQFAALAQPRLAGIRLASGGTLNGPLTMYVAITEKDAEGKPIVPSNLNGILIPSGAVNQSVVVDTVPAAGSWSGYDVWAGFDRRVISWQSGQDGAPPSSITLTGPIHSMTRGLPEAAARRVRIAVKHVWHSGIAGLLITGVPAVNQLQCNDFIGSPDDWVGRIVSAVADQSDGSAPLWNFTITAFDPANGILTVTPDCVRTHTEGSPDPENSVQEGDVLIVRSIPTAADANSVTDDMWDNSVARIQFDSAGLRPHEEIGRVVRILRGTGAGQFRYVADNTATRIDVTPPWTVIPQADSIIIVEAAEWLLNTETTDLAVSRDGYKVELRVAIANLADRVALVGGFLIDDRGRPSNELVAPLREIYIFGQPPTVRVVGPDPGPWLSVATDHTLRADTSIGDVVIQLAPLHVYQGRTLYIANDTGPNTAFVQPSPGEFLFDGSTSVAVAPLETLRVTAG